MKVVIDSNIAVALAIPVPYSKQARQQMAVWQHNQTELFAPMLWSYEVISVLRKFVVNNVISAKEADQAIKLIFALQIEQLPSDIVPYEKVLVWAGRLGQSQAYDAFYIALAEKL